MRPTAAWHERATRTNGQREMAESGLNLNFPIVIALSLALRTVRTHIQNLLRKLEVHSCLEAVTWSACGVASLSLKPF